MKNTCDEMKPAVVPERANQAGEAGPKDWDWVERHVWTERMLETLERGVSSFEFMDFIALQKPTELCSSPRRGKPLTGEPDAGNPPVRFGGKGDANQCVVLTPIDP